jgi:hypothetical protein
VNVLKVSLVMLASPLPSSLTHALRIALVTVLALGRCAPAFMDTLVLIAVWILSAKTIAQATVCVLMANAYASLVSVGRTTALTPRVELIALK